MRRSWPFALLVTLAPLLSDVGCSLSNVKHDDCPSDDACAITFGPGSTCSGGYCTSPASCTSGHDCRIAAGGGACVNGFCVGTLPSNPACTTMYNEPSNLASMRLDGPNPPLIIGGIFSLAASHDQALTDPIRLAVNEISTQGGGLNNGQQMAIVFCDNGGPGDTATGDARAALNVAAFDYLAGTLGVPYIVGPLTSQDSLSLISELNKTQYPTVIISPSATSPELTTTAASLDNTRMFWRTCPSDTLQGQVLAQNLIGPITTIHSVAVIYIQDPYGAGLENAFQTAYAGTVNPVQYSAAMMTAGELSTVATAANATNSDAVLVIAEEGSVAVSILEALAGTPIAAKPFFFTDGSMDANLVSTSNPAAVKAIVQAAQGTAPADPDSTNSTYKAFNADLLSQYGITGDSQSFLAQAYDATYVGAFGVVWASRNGSNYTGVDVAQGMARLHTGSDVVPVGYLDFAAGKGALLMTGGIDITGTSGPLAFNPATGEAPGAIEIWHVAPNLGPYTPTTVIAP